MSSSVQPESGIIPQNHNPKRSDPVNYKTFFGVSLIGLYFLVDAYQLYFFQDSGNKWQEGYSEVYKTYGNSTVLQSQIIPPEIMSVIIPSVEVFKASKKFYLMIFAFLYAFGSISIIGSLSGISWLLLIAHSFQTMILGAPIPSLKDEEQILMRQDTLISDLMLYAMLILVATSVMHPKYRQNHQHNASQSTDRVDSKNKQETDDSQHQSHTKDRKNSTQGAEDKNSKKNK
eukprot:403344563